jgi:transposase-like protein
VDRWREHLAAQGKSGQNVAQYAREHGLSRHTLYVARRLMAEAAKATPKRSRGAARTTPKTGAFATVRVVSSPVALRATLPNGVTLEFAPVEAEAYATLVGLLAALPCSS